MECTPDRTTLELFANKYPDRFVKAMIELGRLAGYADKMQVDVNLTTKVQSLSDSQLEDRLRQNAERLGISVPPILSLEAVEIKSEARPSGSPDEVPEAEGRGESEPRPLR
jgi:hypothetical protein